MAMNVDLINGKFIYLYLYICIYLKVRQHDATAQPAAGGGRK